MNHVPIVSSPAYTEFILTCLEEEICGACEKLL